MKTLLIVLAMVSMLPSISPATTVTMSSTAAGPSVVTSTINLVPNGSFVRIGTFLGGIETLENWRDWGTTTVKDAGAGTSKRASKLNGTTVNTGGEADDSQFNGLPVYVWVYNSATISLTADQAIFRSTVLWPTNDPVGLGDAISVPATSLTGVALEGFSTGQYVTGVSNLTGNLTGGQLILGAAVPEISTSMMLVTLLGMIVGRRRR